MSWAEVKKINSNLSVPLDVSIPKTLLSAIVGDYVYFTEDGTFEAPNGVSTVYISMIGAGGNGGNAGASRTVQTGPDDWTTIGGGGGGGGGRGAYLVDTAFATTGEPIIVTVGKNAGTRTTSFGDSLTLAGGTNGGNGTDTYSGSTGGAAGSIGGSAGGTGSSSPGAGGAGGKVEYFDTYGNGGNGGTNGAGAKGYDGIVVVTWGSLRYADVWDLISAELNG